MKDYWDSSAVIEACNNPSLRDRLHRERGLTRVHTLAEVFSTLTGGNLAFRLDAEEAAKTVANLASDLDFQDLSATDVLKALKEARKKGVHCAEDFYLIGAQLFIGRHQPTMRLQSDCCKSN